MLVQLNDISAMYLQQNDSLACRVSIVAMCKKNVGIECGKVLRQGRNKFIKNYDEGE